MKKNPNGVVHVFEGGSLHVSLYPSTLEVIQSRYSVSTIRSLYSLCLVEKPGSHEGPLVTIIAHRYRTM